MPKKGRRRHISNIYIFDALIPHGQDQLKAQADSVESIEAKAGYIMASEGIVLTIITTLYNQFACIGFNFLSIIGLIALILGFLSNIGVLWIKKLDVGLRIDNFYDEFNKKDNNTIRFKALYTINLALVSNSQKLQEKSRFFQASLALFGASILLIVLGVAFQFNSHYTQCMDNNAKHGESGATKPQNQQQKPSQSNQAQQINSRWSSSHQTAGTTPFDIFKGYEDFTKK